MAQDKPAVSTANSRSGALTQDKAAGGVALRKMRTRSGEVVTVSLSITDVANGSRIILRFKSGGATVQRPVGTVKAASRFEALKQGWRIIRTEKIVEREGWAWVETAHALE